jgi:hypothetical protein
MSEDHRAIPNEFAALRSCWMRFFLNVYIFFVNLTRFTVNNNAIILGNLLESCSGFSSKCNEERCTDGCVRKRNS